MPNHASTSLCHPTETRALSLREYAKIQEFPDDWIFCGRPTQQYAQVGNAVPVRLGRVSGELIADELDKIKARRGQKYSPKSDSFRIVYVQSHIRTRQWYKNGESVVWKDGKKNSGAKYTAPRKKTKTAIVN